jgi:hypothetical protein
MKKVYAAIEFSNNWVIQYSAPLELKRMAKVMQVNAYPTIPNSY